MDCGKLNKRITILELKDRENEINNLEQDLKEKCKKWCMKIDLDKGSEYIESKRAVQTVLSKFVIRKCAWITQDYFIKYKNKTYDIIDVVEKDNYTHLYARIKGIGNCTYQNENISDILEKIEGSGY